MRFFGPVAARLAESEMVQLLLLLLGVLSVVTAIAWPSAGSVANESWFTVGPFRNTALALAAAGLGAHRRLAPGGEVPRFGLAQAVSLATVLVWAVLTLPIEVLAYAATYPSVQPWWPSLVTAVTLPAYFGLGLALEAVSRAAHVKWLLPVTVPGAVVLLAWLDYRLDSALFNPWTAPLARSPYPLVMGFVALVSVVVIASGALGWRRGGR